MTSRKPQPEHEKRAEDDENEAAKNARCQLLRLIAVKCQAGLFRPYIKQAACKWSVITISNLPRIKFYCVQKYKT